MARTNKGTYNRTGKSYAAWYNARQRCINPKNSQYKNYGALGIEHKLSYEEMIDSIGLAPGKEYSLDRINPLRHYEVGNIRWITMREQQSNKRNTYRDPNTGELLYHQSGGKTVSMRVNVVG